jgi:hypothetical protein
LIPSGLTNEWDNKFGINYYSLQINTNRFNTSTAYTGDKEATGWEQFAYENNFTANTGYVSIWFWLLNYGTCPTNVSWHFSWKQDGSNCYYYSVADAPPVLPTALNTVKLLASVSNKNDTLEFCVGKCYSVESQSLLNLYQYWDKSEFNVFGDGDGSEAFFNSGTSINVLNQLNVKPECSSPTPPPQGYTAETNNLALESCKVSGDFILFDEDLPALTAPTISAVPAKIYAGESSILTIVEAPKYGTLPYTCNWFYMYPGALAFSYLTSTPSPCRANTQVSTGFLWKTGLWLFELNVTDSSAIARGSGIPNETVSADILVDVLEPYVFYSSHSQIYGGFGYSVAVDSYFKIVGAYNETADGFLGAGHAYVFDAQTGALIRTLTSPDAQVDGHFGCSVAISGYLVVVGACGESSGGFSYAGNAYVFDAQTGALVQTLTSPSAQHVGFFGLSVAISGYYAVVSAPLESSGGFSYAGNAYVFDAQTGALVQTLTSPSAQEDGSFGLSVAITGTLATVGAPYETSGGFSEAGNAYVFDAQTGALLQTLTSPDAQAEGSFGYSVAASGNIVTIGAYNETADGFLGAGRAYVFNAQTGVLMQSLTSSDEQNGGFFGTSVAEGNGVVAVGAVPDPPVYAAGLVDLFNAQTGALLQTLTSPNAQAEGSFGWAIAISGNIMMIGAYNETAGGVTGAGNAYEYPALFAATTTVSCSAALVVVGSAVSCRATVQGTTPTGVVYWSSNSTGKFSGASCKLSKGACSAKFTPSAAGSSVIVTASYAGDTKNFQSPGTYGLTVMKKVSKTTVSCAPKSAAAGSSTIIICTAKVMGYSPTGSVTWSQTGTGSVSFVYSPPACTLAMEACSVAMNGTTAGEVTIQGTYGGDPNNEVSSGTAKLTIAKAPTVTTISCTASSFGTGSSSSITCTATVTSGYPSPTGTVTWSRVSGKGGVTFSSETCTLSASGTFTCTVTVTGNSAGNIKIKATYGGDSNDLKSAGTYVLTIT